MKLFRARTKIRLVLTWWPLLVLDMFDSFNRLYIELNWTDTSLQYSTATEGYVSNDFFRLSLDDSQTSYLTQGPSSSLNTVELLVVHNRPCKHSSKLQLSIRFTPSRCLDVRQDWYPMYNPEGMKARVSPVQSIKPHRILAPTRDSNQKPSGPQSKVVTTILTLGMFDSFNRLGMVDSFN